MAKNDIQSGSNQRVIPTLRPVSLSFGSEPAVPASARAF
jgi:hypothetical protein